MKKPQGPRLRKIPPGDNRERLVCPDCDYIHYENPKLVVGIVTTWQGKYLLCRRSIEPRRGFWTFPAGFMEMGESPLEGARREAKEEACADVVVDGLLAVYHIRHIGQVQMIYRGVIRDGRFAAGEESLEARLFDYDEIPWDELAFPTVDWGLRHHHEVRERKEWVTFSNPTRFGEDPPKI